MINEESHMELTSEGKVVQKCIEEIEGIYDNVIIDEYVVMPNHVHLLVKITFRNGISVSRVIQR